MKTSLLVLLLLIANTAFAQRFGYINSQFIVDKMPQYAEAKKEIDQITTQWQQEIDTLQQDLNRIRAAFEAEKVLFTEDMKQRRMADIAEKENDLRALQNKYFGFDGQLFKKRDQIMRNLQEKIFEAARKVAKKRKIHFIFDKASDLAIIYSDSTYDFTNDVLAEMGLADANVKPNTKGTENNEQNTNNENNNTNTKEGETKEGETKKGGGLE
jgi:outer membrane protein